MNKSRRNCAEIAAFLTAEAKRLRDFVSYAEANRDDWFVTMPPDVSERATYKAGLYEAAAAALAEDVEATVEIEKMLNDLDED